MVKTCESRFPPSPNLDKVTVRFDKVNNADLFLQIHGVYIVHTFCKGTQHLAAQCWPYLLWGRFNKTLHVTV